MALYGEDLAEFMKLVGQIGPMRERLQQQNNALGATITTVAGYAAQLQAWVDAGDVDPNHLVALANSVKAAVVPGKVSSMIEALNVVAGMDPPLRLVTDDDGDGSAYTPVTPTA